MQGLNYILLSSIFLQGTLFSKLVFDAKRHNSTSNALILLFSVVLLLHLVNLYIYEFSNLDIPFHVLPVAIVSYGPIIYTYVKTLNKTGTAFSRPLIYPFIPVLLVAIVHIVGHDSYRSWQHITFHAFIYGYSLVYLVMSIRMVYLNLVKGRHEWIWTYHFLLLVTCLLLFIALDYGRFVTSWNWFNSFNTTGIIWLGFCITLVLLLQNLLYPHAIRSQKRLKSNNSTLSTKNEELIVEFLKCLTEQGNYLKPDLTIGELAKELKVTSHALSRAVNEQLNKSFLEVVNQLRVERACELLKDSDLKILAVALESGFSNKTTFNRTFKKYMGTRPSRYRIQHHRD